MNGFALRKFVMAEGGAMRIVAGELKGRAIEAPEGNETRPTTDRVREALMSSLYSLLGGFEGQRVLDAFAGSGALGIEAISRGAAYAEFFENGKKAFRVLQGNLRSCGLEGGRAHAWNRDVTKAFDKNYVKAETTASLSYSLIFLDPPYQFSAEAVASFVQILFACGAAQDDATVVYEFAQKDAARAEAAFCDFDIKSKKKYGKTGVMILGKREGSHS